ncbi:MAG: hypothetical protein XD94_1581, partial [Mesotoga prima]
LKKKPPQSARALWGLTVAYTEAKKRISSSPDRKNTISYDSNLPGSETYQN